MLLLSALFIASVAAWFSVVGISQLFVGESLAAIVMALSLELGKLVAVSFVYRYWTTVNKLLRAYMLVGSIVLSAVTSAGIYGYLSSAYAVSAVEFNASKRENTLLETKQNSLDKLISLNETRISQLTDVRNRQEERLTQLVGKNGFITQQTATRQTETDLRNLQAENMKLVFQRDSLENIKVIQNNVLQTTSKLGTFSHISDMLSVPLDVIVKWFILILVLVFDPMAIALVLAFNSITKDKSQRLIEIVNAHPPEDSPPKSEYIPYYSDPNYNWDTDHRWKTDDDAKLYKSQLQRVDK